MLNFLLLSAGLGWRIKSKEPRSMLDIAGKSLLKRQSDNIRKCFPVENPTSISIVSGFKPGRVRKESKSLGVKHFNNNKYKDTNQIESIRIFLNNSNVDNLFIIHGDLDFRIKFNEYQYDESFTLYDDRNNFKQDEVGINIVDGFVNNLSYGLNTKWSQMFFLTGLELKLLKNICNTDNTYYLTFEILNKIIDLGGNFKAYRQNDNIYELDTIEEINNANFNC